jgi:hypothetical protein
VQVTVTHTAGHHSHNYLVLGRFVDLDVLDGQRLMGSMEDGGLHVFSPQ